MGRRPKLKSRPKRKTGRKGYFVLKEAVDETKAIIQERREKWESVICSGSTNNDMFCLHMELKGPFSKKMLCKGVVIDQDLSIIWKITKVWHLFGYNL
ncbi:predicted protein [Arabidopsis lyrata subsp. lyrata]|uniref:Predicted protein n=1 Tax=Arabidopsis lyrata subsp. lyrata TaxID=81972 RepID=D7L745_ARALL|nr:predicted protein [Arabidopsis lyrata subsp. lyrata]